MDREIAPDSVDKAMRFAMATMEVTLATMGLPTPVEPDRRDRIIAELRAVLAPLLDAQHHWTPKTLSRRTDQEGRILEGWELVCMFCRCEPDQPHAPDCAVLRRDELLGR